MPEEGQTISRRAVLALIAAAGGGSATAALGVENGDGNLTGGTMALNEPYQAGERLWIGPDSARSQVDAKSGRVYIGASGDGYTFYNGDNGSWDTKGLGDSSNPIPSLTLEQALNSSIGDGVDYLDPMWLAETDYSIIVLDGYSGWSFNTNTSGSGSISGSSAGGTRFEISTGSTSGSVAQATQSVTGSFAEFDKQSRFVDHVAFRDTGDVIVYCCVGDVDGGNPGYGFKLDGTTLQGVAHDGTSESTTDLVTGLSSSYSPGLRARLYPGDRVEFEVIDDGVVGSLSTGLSSGGANDETISYNIENTTASNKRLYITERRWVQAP